MRKNPKSTRLLNLALTLAAACAAAPAYARADTPKPQAGRDGFADLFEQFFGSEDSRNNAADCRGPDGDAREGSLGRVNRIFCHLEKDMGIQGAGSSTRTFGKTTVHCEIADLPPVSGYDHAASCWACVGTGCTSPASFNPLLNAVWRYSPDKTVNKGMLIEDPQAFDGTPGTSGLSYGWDLGTSTTLRMMSAREVSGSAKLNVAAQRSGNVLKAQLVTASTAFDAAVDTSLDVALVNYQASGGGACSSGLEGLTGKTAASSCTACYSRARLEDDWNYSSAPASACSGLALADLPDTPANVGAYTADSTVSTTVLNQSINGKVWNGMAAHPASL